MSVVRVPLNGREYDIACEDGQEEHLQTLAADVDRRLSTLVREMGGNPGEVMTLVLASLMMADEIIENKKELKKSRAPSGDPRLLELEQAVAQTLETIATRIENIADRVEMG